MKLARFHIWFSIKIKCPMHLFQIFRKVWQENKMRIIGFIFPFFYGTYIVLLGLQYTIKVSLKKSRFSFSIIQTYIFIKPKVWMTLCYFCSILLLAPTWLKEHKIVRIFISFDRVFMERCYIIISLDVLVIEHTLISE